MKLQLRQEKSSLACVCFIQCKEKRRMKRKSEEKDSGIFCSIGLIGFLSDRSDWLGCLFEKCLFDVMSSPAVRLLVRLAGKMISCL
ncbi:hypothetical protein T01_14649 [Trichinella spiralis]|uniref:Uncharacterized protein n=1 Tax=Trichinella spiralis TaxID=6334 RepID=A0A0V1AY92_TRISP|nr:hypothetical protein T01_14253 [Trichinella spiralis]KRY29701.1 hypothetical protein T01_14649 [Trichinella spiralis]